MNLFDVTPLLSRLLWWPTTLFSKVAQFLSRCQAFTRRSRHTFSKSIEDRRDKKLTILQTPIRFYPAIGGVENHVYYLSKELIKNGNEVKVICANEPLYTDGKIDSIIVERLKYSFKIANTNIAFSLPLRILGSHFDVLHTHMPTPWSADWSVLIAKVMHKRSVITIHNDMDKSSSLSKLVAKIYVFTLFKLTLTLVDKIIIVNPNWESSFFSTKKILMTYKKKISIVPNGVDISLFRSHDKSNMKKPSVLFISILDKHHKFKGIDYLLDAIRIVKYKYPDIELKIIGEGELKKYYQEKTKTLGIDNDVHFIGEIKQEDLVSYYNTASTFILPSTEIEGFGIVLLEAMACNVPVIATNIVGTSSDIKKHNTGLVVEPKNAEELAKAIITIINTPTRAKNMGDNGRKLVEEKYDWRKIAKQVQRLY
jgi:glycosyltransferase involved in cell wall biosynthesis